jgi:hypothetical protein
MSVEDGNVSSLEMLCSFWITRCWTKFRNPVFLFVLFVLDKSWNPFSPLLLIGGLTYFCHNAETSFVFSHSVTCAITIGWVTC